MTLINPLKWLGIAVLILTIILSITVKWWLPYFIVEEVKQWYSQQGENYHLEINEVDIKPLSGSIQLSGVKLKQNQKEDLLLSAYIDVHLLSLFQKHFIIENLTLSGLTFNIFQQKDLLKIAGVNIEALSAVNNDEKKEIKKSDSEINSQWQVSILNIGLDDINIHYRDDKRQFALKIDEMDIKGEKGANQLSTTIKATIQELREKELGISFQKELLIEIEGKVFDIFNDPYWKGMSKISNMHLSTETLKDISIQELRLKDVELKNNKVDIASIHIDNLKLNNNLMSLKSYQINGVLYQNGSLVIAKQEIKDWETILGFNQNNEIAGVNINQDTKDSAKRNTNHSEMRKREFDLHLSKISVFGENRLFIKDQHTNPKVNLEFLLKDLRIRDVGNQGHRGSLKLAGKFDEYSDLDVEGDFNIKEKEYSINMSLEQFDLTTLNGYIERAVGYHVERGLLDIEIKAVIKGTNIEGDAEILIRKIALEPTDEEAIERISRQISMPIGTALSILTDSSQNLKLQVPISGNLMDPNFGKTDLIYILSKKVIKIATKHYLTQALFPYGLLVNAVEYVGDEIFSIKLESLKIEDEKLTDLQVKNVRQVAEIMKDKDDLQLYICPIYDRSSIRDDWQEISRNQAGMIKKTLVDIEQDLSARIVLCEPKLADKTEVMLGF